MLAQSIPPKFTISDPVSIEAAADGTVDSLKFNASSDLSAAAIVFGDSFNKPAGVPLKIVVEGSRVDSAVKVALANVTLGDLAMKATNIKVGGRTTSARI